MPLRLWIVGYALQCVLHMVCVCVEYRKRYSQRNSEGSGSGRAAYSRNYSNSSSGSDDVESGGYATERRQTDDETRSVQVFDFSIFRFQEFHVSDLQLIFAPFSIAIVIRFSFCQSLQSLDYKGIRAKYLLHGTLMLRLSAIFSKLNSLCISRREKKENLDEYDRRMVYFL